MTVINLDSYKNWKQHGYVKSSIPISCNDGYKNFIWHETYMIDEVPKDDVWDNFATKSKLELDKFYKDIDMPKECSKHYMAFRPILTNGLEKIIDIFNDKTYNYNFLKLTAGYNLFWHYDSYSTFVKFNNIDQNLCSKINRTIVMMDSWKQGQILQVGNDIASHWNAGDTFTWNSDTWHGLSNFGFDDLVLMQITWI